MDIKRRAGRIRSLAVIAGALLQSLALGAPPDWARLTEREAVPGELIVVYRDEAVAGRGQTIGLHRQWRNGRTPAAVTRMHASLKARVKSRFRTVPAEVVALPEGTDPAAAAAAYAAQPDVAAVYPNRRYYPSAYTPNDPLWPQLWGMAMVGVDQAWESHPVMNTATVVVAVIDTGILRTHPDLADIIWTNPGEIPGNGIDDDANGYIDDVSGWDFFGDNANGNGDEDNDPSDQHGHGTHVSGTIGAIRDNGIGVAGFSPAIRILPVRGLGEFGTSESLGRAIEYVALMSPYVKLSNNSWGGSGDDPIIGAMIEVSRAAGQMFVAAAGNESYNIDVIPSHPGGMPNANIVSVASVNENDELSNFSNYGVKNVDIAAPGGTTLPNSGNQIVSTWYVPVDTNGLYNGISGTSMASPHVAGAAAYLWALKPNATYDEIAAALYDGAAVNPALAGYVAGARRLDLAGAIGALAFAPFQPSRFYGDPGNGFPISNGGVATSTVSSVWSEDCTVDIAVDGDPVPWLTVVTPPPAVLAAGGSAPLTVMIDPNVPGFPTAPGAYSNTVSLTFTPMTGPAITVERVIWFRLSKTYFVQSAPFAWVDAGVTNRLTVDQLTGGTLPLPTNVTFNYYNRTYSDLRVQPNGILLFEPPEAGEAAGNTTLPDEMTGAAGLFPNWMPTSLSGGWVLAGAATVDARPAFVVTWSNVVHAADSAARFDYQVVLFDAGGGEGSEIRYQYRRVAQDAETTGMGRSSTVGLQSDGGYLAAHYTVNGHWRPAPGMEYDPCPGWVDGLPMDLADGQTLRWTWGARDAETTPPAAVITPLIVMIDEIRYEVRFNEIVFELDAADLLFDTTVPGLTLGAITGGGERFLVEIDDAVDQYGLVALQLNANAVYDLEQNWNAAAFGTPPRAIPYCTTHLRDDFERGPGLWKASAHGGTTDFTDGGWEFGTPYPGVLGGPAAAFSGTNCWGTFLGSTDWTSANGYPNGWYPGGSAFAMQAQLDSPRAHVGDFATVRFKAFWSFPATNAFATILAVPGATGDPIMLAMIDADSGGNWQTLRYRLPDSLAGQEVFIRIVVTSPYGDSGPGLYVDDFELYSAREPGVYFLGFVPETVPAPSASHPIQVVAYSTHTADVTQVEGVLASPVAGVSVAAGQRVPFGTITYGGVATASVPCSVAAGPYPSRRVPIQGNAYIRGLADQTSYPILLLDTAVESFTRHLVAKTGATGVRDWLGRPLRGDGGDASAGYQILWAGPDAAINPPAADGTPGGDDRVLYSTGAGLPFERFGTVAVAADAGLFSRAFSHNLGPGARLYARAWDGPTFDQSVAYGDSAIRQLTTGLAGEIVDFGVWTVGMPVQYARDLNGDGIPDGYAVTHPTIGLDPREFPDPAADRLRVLAATVCSKSGFRPIRVELFRNRVYILYINNTGQNGAIEVRDLALTGLLQTVIHGVDSGNPLLNVTGMAIDRANGKLYVTEASTACRIYRYGLSASGALAYEATVAHALKPTDVAVDGIGRVYIADNRTSIKRYPALLAGAPAAVLGTGGVATTERVSIFGDNAYRTFLDSTYQVHQVHRWSLAGGSLNGTFGLPQPELMLKSAGYLLAPAKVCQGVGGWLYVADRSHHRIQVFDAGGGYLARTPAGEPAASDLPGRFDLPTAVSVTNAPFGDHVIYVADEKNNRVQRLNVILDVDQDGMDDVWEVQHGLDPADPGDALLDNDADGLSNLGEYRLRRDPNDPDTNQDGLGDAFDLFEHAVYPIGATPAQVTNLVAVVATNGATVAITVFFDKAELLNAPVQLDLSGGAYVNDAILAMNGSVGTYTYAVQPGDAGWVTVAISGPFQDPPVYTAVDAFELAAAPAPTTALTALTATPGLVGANTVVVVGATFSAPVSDAAVTIKAADGAPVVAGAAMTPSAPAPTDSWSYTHLPSPTATNRWFVVSLASSGLPGGASPLQASFAVIDPRILAFTKPPAAVTWNALTGVLYRVEARDDLLAGSWQTVLATNRPGPEAAAPLTVFPPDDPASNRFYRVVAP